MQVIEVPGVGEVEFPDGMGDAEILAAVKKLSATAPATMAAHGSAPTYVPPSRLESSGRGALQGATAGTSDELAGIGRAFGSPRRLREATTPGLRDYKAGRDAERAANAAAQAANPGTYLASQVLGAVPGGMAMPGGLASMTAQGALAGAGYSDADSARGLAGDAALGAAGGLAARGIGAGVGKIAGGLARKGAQLVRSATARAGAQAAGEVAEDVASAAGRVGGEVQKGSRQVENLMRLEASMTPEQRAIYDAMVGQGIVPDLQQSVAQSTLEALPGQAATIATRKAELAALQQAAPATAAARTAALTSGQEAGRQLRARLLRYGPPMVGSAIGTAIGGPVGSGIGWLAGAGSRPAIRSWIRYAQNPAVQIRIGQALENAAERTDIVRRLMEAGVPAAAIAAMVDRGED